MKILLSNKYFFPKGGAENSVFQTAKLLEGRGHSVSFFAMSDTRNLPTEHSKYFVSNVEYDNPSACQSVKAAGRLLYSWESRRNIERLIREQKPDLAHLNNIYHQISPSILHSLKKYLVPVVMSLRDYKLVCASYSMVADGNVCEACGGGQYYQCLLKKCVKDSRAKSLLNTIEMYLHHKILHIYDLVDVFISPSKFLKNKVEEMGFRGRVEYLPNFVNTEEYAPKYEYEEQAVVYFGRLSREKGLLTLIDAMKSLPDVKLKLIGEGPIKDDLADKIQSNGMRNVEFLGYKSGNELEREIRKSMFVVLPSEWHENNPRSVIEAFTLGKPAIGARIGGIPELVRDHETGMTFESGNACDLADKIRALSGRPDLIVEMGRKARRFVEDELNPQRHYEQLMSIYNSVLR